MRIIFKPCAKEKAYTYWKNTLGLIFRPVDCISTLNNTATDFNFSLADLEHILYQKAMEWARDTYRRILECVDDQLRKARAKSFAIKFS
jgi:hypothetical protein